MRLATFRPVSDAASGPRDPWRVALLTPDGSGLVEAAPALAWWRPTNGFEAPRDSLAWYDIDGPWFHALARLDETLQVDEALLAQMTGGGFVHPLAACRLGSPVPRPGKIVCVGLNYRDHAAEARMAVPEAPVVFAKFPSAVIGPDAAIVLPRSSVRVDYEAELAVVVGRRARHVLAEHAPDVVLGYMNANDVSEREFQKRDGQWVRAKSCDTFCPLGPWLVTADRVTNPGDLRVRLRLNGRTMQDSSTREFVFDVPRLVAFLSETMTLEPGDVILTGTPPGVGFARTPPVYLAPGDVTEVEIEGLGVLRNAVSAEPGT